jgi:E3 ubiquitin-protein ligase CHFR
MESKNLSPNNVFQTICQRIDSGQYVYNNVGTRVQVTTNAYCCYNCATFVFRDLIYNYRADIPNSELPNEVTSRPMCWYGRECRTQTHNYNHARRYNHIGENQRPS